MRHRTVFCDVYPTGETIAVVGAYVGSLLIYRYGFALLFDNVMDYEGRKMECWVTSEYAPSVPVMDIITDLLEVMLYAG